jgi:S-adenosylmethionine:tRNA ribosyltransferase-isomerase
MLRGKGIPVGAELAFQTSEQDSSPIPLQGTVSAKEEGPAMTTFVVAFQSELAIEKAFATYGTVPLPPYIDHSHAQPDQYQTVFAGETGSAAAPTAGLHFTPELIERLMAEGHTWQEVTLHVGMGTFLPLRQEEVTKNQLHKEAAYVSPEVAKIATQTRAEHKRLLAIGTTSTRTLESHMEDGQLVPGWKHTDLFIYPGYPFKIVNGLLTNFHLPKSSLLLLVAAFIGNHPDGSGPVLSEQEMIGRLRRIYQEAISQQYRFFSFGDAMLIL